jgi:molecular chaperone Hsp33
MPDGKAASNGKTIVFKNSIGDSPVGGHHSGIPAMIKKKICGEDLKARLIAGLKDRLYYFTLASGTVRGVLVNGTLMINEMRANHKLGILETLVLGRAYLGAALMSANLKGGDRLSLKIDCSGPIKGFTVDANAFGEVRGYLKNVPIPIENPLKSFDLSPFFGAGLLSVTRYIADAKHPFTGKVALKYGNVAQDLAHYCRFSEQIPSAFNLGIQFDRSGEVVGAGGLFLQAMPGADEVTVADLEKRVSRFPSLGKVFQNNRDAEALIRQEFRSHSPRVFADRRIEFMCHCSKGKVRSILMMLPIDDLRDILANGPFPFESRCHNCNSLYAFDRDDIRRICGLRFPDN